MESGQEDTQALDIIIRMLDAEERGALPESFRQPLEFAVQQAGLFPYLKSDSSSLPELALVHSHSIGDDHNFVLHAPQMQVLLRLIQGENVILSAPTSFGKSAIVDAYLERKNPDTVVIVVPTIALIDEVRRRLQRKFSDKYAVIFHRAQIRKLGEPVIYVLTQERLMDREDITTIDFFVVDEFYKLDPARKDPRHQTLNVAVYKYSKISKQIYMAGPHISSISLGPEWRERFAFVQTSYKTVAANVKNRAGKIGQFQRFLEDFQKAEGGSLIFTKSPPSAKNLLTELIKQEHRRSIRLEASQLAAWIARNYHHSWLLVDALKSGFGIHHGKVPRSIAYLLVREFEQGGVHTLVCTSTLIEGVNTSAKNIFIYDKKIDRTNFDFFSFANIRGRVGRMMRHFVGNVFLYHIPPEDEEIEVEIPVFNDPSTAGDAILLNVDSVDLPEVGLRRRDDLLADSGLPLRLLQRYASMGVDRLISTLTEVRGVLEREPNLLLWHGRPTNKQRKKVIEIAWNNFLKSKATGAVSASQMALYAHQLWYFKTLPKFFNWFVDNNRSRPVDAFDYALEFLRCCDFALPNSICAVQDIVNAAMSRELADYTLYAKQLEDFFRPEWVRALDELGIPIPIGEKLKGLISVEASIDGVVYRLREMVSEDKLPLGFDDMDRKIIRDALMI